MRTNRKSAPCWQDFCGAARLRSHAGMGPRLDATVALYALGKVGEVGARAFGA